MKLKLKLDHGMRILSILAMIEDSGLKMHKDKHRPRLMSMLEIRVLEWNLRENLSLPN